jgi:hypothetical protein
MSEKPFSDFQSSALPTELPSQPFISNRIRTLQPHPLDSTSLFVPLSFVQGVTRFERTFLFKMFIFIIEQKTYHKTFYKRKRIVRGLWKRNGWF